MSDGELTEHKEKNAQEKKMAPKRSLLIYLLACVIGCLMLDTFSTTGTFSLLGTMLLGYGATVLVCEEKLPFAYLVVVVVGAIGLYFDPAGGVYALFLGTIVVAMASRIPKGFGQSRYVVSALLMAVTMLCVDSLTAYLSGITYAGRVTAMVTTTIQTITAAGTVPAEMLTILENHVTSVASLWPSFYVVQGLVCVVLVVEVSKVAVRRHVASANPSGFSRFDLSIHMLILPIIALACLAVSSYDIPSARNIGALGYNLAVIAAALFAIQGYAVSAFLMLKRKWHWALRIVIYLLLVQLELMFLLPTLIGLVDLWVNIRKLPRGEGTQTKETGQKN